MTHQEFKARFLPCHKKMYYIAFRYLGNEYDAEDMVQNTCPETMGETGKS